MPSQISPVITDSITQTSVINIGMAPAISMGQVYLMGAQAIGLSMQNASSYQQNMQQLGTSITGVVCAMVIAKGGGG